MTQRRVPGALLTRRQFAGRGWVIIGAAQAGVAAAQVPDWSLAAQLRLGQGPASSASLAGLRELLAQGQRHLETGDADAAEQTFERAALQVHAPDIELALVRTHMQAGRYRQALAFGAHAAGAHRTLPAAAALYAWLLRQGGQHAAALHTLDEALARAPGDTTLLPMRARLVTTAGVAADAAAPAPWPPMALRLGPYATFANDPTFATFSTVATPGNPAMAGPTGSASSARGASRAVQPAGSRGVGTALLTADGTLALAPAALVADAGPLWLRNGLGQTVPARVWRSDAALGVALLRLGAALPAPADWVVSPRPPFSGSPLSMVDYEAAPDGQPAWPLLRVGFAGRPLAAAGDRLLGISAPPGPRGGPVFDASGRWCGMALPGADGRDRWLAADGLLARFGLPAASAASAASAFSDSASAAVPSPPPPTGPAARAALDAVYETALRATLQVLVAA